MKTNNKMREALEDIVHGIEEKYAAAPTQVTPHEDAILHRCKTALAEPVKNCEVGTAEEQLKRFKDFCRIISKDETCDGCPLLPQCPTLEHCAIAWGQMPHKEGGAK